VPTRANRGLAADGLLASVALAALAAVGAALDRLPPSPAPLAAVAFVLALAYGLRRRRAPRDAAPATGRLAAIVLVLALLLGVAGFALVACGAFLLAGTILVGILGETWLPALALCAFLLVATGGVAVALAFRVAPALARRRPATAPAAAGVAAAA
jgi:hypothetical protein